MLEGSNHVQMYVSSIGFQAQSLCLQRERAHRQLAGSVSPIRVVGLLVMECHSTTWDLAGNTAIVQGVSKMEAG
jgi:hypothetical protein